MAKFVSTKPLKQFKQRSHIFLNRKKRRREERLAFKQRKHAHYLKKKVSTEDTSLKSEENRVKLTGKKLRKKETKVENDLNFVHRKSTLVNDEKKVMRKAQNMRKRQLLEANMEEDKVIKRLEKSLKLNKRKSKTLPKSYFDDGLAYILDLIDNPQSTGVDDIEMSDTDGEFSENVVSATKKASSKVKSLNACNEISSSVTGKLSSDLSFDHIDTESDNESDENNVNGSEESDSQMTKDDENGSNSDASNSCDKKPDNDEFSTADSKLNKIKKKVHWEDIYGRLRDKEGNIVKAEDSRTATSGKYIPPAKRQPLKTEDAKKKEELANLRKQLKGLLNRLSEANVQPISKQIEEMYMKHSRNDVNDTLTCLIFEVVVSPSLTPERLVMEHAMLIALLHGNVGSEVGAYFLQNLGIRFQKLQNQGMMGDGKESDNLLMLLAHIYNFKVTHSTLVYDILHILIESFKEKDIELILLLLRAVGFNLRKDDPLTLKEVVLEIQKQAASVSTQQNESRVRFMLDILTAIRNNNMYKIPNYDPSLIEHLKKRMKGMFHKGCYIQELRISLKDLLKAEERGRWWIVGSAWTGSEQSMKKDDADTEVQSQVDKFSISEKILDLARKQRMNTDVRKNIFCIIMTSEDYTDAFEKLLRLGLKNQQEREIIHVILDCCLQENKYNPFYAYLAEKFCRFDRRYHIVLQFALWDKFKEFSNMKSWQLNHLADLLVHLFTTSTLPLTILKVIQFSEMKKPVVYFLKRILLPILLHNSEEVCSSTFQRIAIAPNMNLLREGLRLFMHHFILRNKDKLNFDIELLTDRIRLVEKILNSAKKIFAV